MNASSPYQRVRAANAGGYSTALIAPSRPRPRRRRPSRRTAPGPPRPGRARPAEPAVISHRGPAGRAWPTAIPRAAETTRPSENAAVSRAVTSRCRRDPARQHRERVVKDSPAGGLGDAQRCQHPTKPATGVRAGSGATAAATRLRSAEQAADGDQLRRPRALGGGGTAAAAGRRRVGVVEQSGATADPGVGQGQLDPGAAS